MIERNSLVAHTLCIKQGDGVFPCVLARVGMRSSWFFTTLDRCVIKAKSRKTITAEKQTQNRMCSVLSGKIVMKPNRFLHRHNGK